ncbi:HlyD family efflux transporter periplasmic adaptor subunit [Candidatus Gracilibacteria bacterium]|nr:HlyD family efflux transporter periplasmic adaptor subunit [Candidatus Gracilibacteria bacterium]
MRKTLISILLISGILLTSCGTQEVVEKKNYQTYDVKTGNLSTSDSILSIIEGQNTTSLSFKAPGKIAQIYVKTGDKVKTGDILATLGNEEGNITYAGLLNIMSSIDSMGYDTNNIKEAINSLYDQRLNLLQDSYSKSLIATQMAQKDLDLAKNTLADSNSIFSGSILSTNQKIQQAKNALKMSQNNLDNSKKLLDNEKENIVKNALNSLSNAYIIARNSLDYTDEILGVTDMNKYKNDSYEVYLGAKNSQTKTIVENTFREFKSKYDETHAYYEQNIIGKKNIDKEILIITLKKALDTLENLRNLLHDTKDVLDNSITSSSFNENALNGIKGQISTLISNLEQAILSPSALGMVGVKGSIEAIDSFDKNYNLKMKQLEDAVDIAAQDVEMAKTGLDISKSDISKNKQALETNVKIKEDSLNLARIGEQEVLKNIELVKNEKTSKLAEINAKTSEIDSKKSENSMNANLAANSIESGIIRSPFDGIITSKMMDIGTTVGAGTPIIGISSLDKKLVKTYIDNSKYNLKIGDKIKVRDSKDFNEYDATIKLVDTTQNLNNKKNYIEIEVNSQELNIGDRVSILLNKEKDNKALIIIPTKAIIYKYSQPGVFILENNTAKFKLIEITGSDETFSSVNGLKVGDKIITDGKDNILDGEVLN